MGGAQPHLLSLALRAAIWAPKLAKKSRTQPNMNAKSKTHWHGLFSQISGPLQVHLSYVAYTGYRLSHASNTNWQLLPINHWQQHNQPTCICYFSSINALDRFGQVARTCWRCLWRLYVCMYQVGYQNSVLWTALNDFCTKANFFKGLIPSPQEYHSHYRSFGASGLPF